MLRMIAEQEELDWDVYHSYGLLDDDLTYAGDDLPGLRLGERAFEITLAREVAAGEESTAVVRHGTARRRSPRSPPTGRRPTATWCSVDSISSSRTSSSTCWSVRSTSGAGPPSRGRSGSRRRCGVGCSIGWRIGSYWFDAHGRPTARSVAQLADVVSRDADLVSVLELWSGRKDRSVTENLSALLADESVPFLAAHRLKDSGLRKREAWEQTWELAAS